MSLRPATAEERALVNRAVARLRSAILALAFGLVSGSGLLLATVWLVLRGGDPVGPHLGLLGIYFPGYEVSWAGSLVGFAWGFAVGAAVGGFTGWVYNRVAAARQPRG